MPKHRPKDRNRIVIETPLKAPESQAGRTRRKLGVVNPNTTKWWDQQSHPALLKG